MPRPEYIVCLECQTEVDDFSWRDGEIRKANCDVCGNNDADAFALPEDYDQDYEDEETEEYDEEDEYLDDYDEADEEEA